MTKFHPSPALIAAARASRLASLQQAGVPLYLPAISDQAAYAALRHEAEAEDIEVDASGITIGGDEDDDFY